MIDQLSGAFFPCQKSLEAKQYPISAMDISLNGQVCQINRSTDATN
jgi:hypothetical protein